MTAETWNILIHLMAFLKNYFQKSISDLMQIEIYAFKRRLHKKIYGLKSKIWYKMIDFFFYILLYVEKEINHFIPNYQKSLV